MRIVAIISIRNEEHYLPVILEYLSQQNIEVVIIDHESSDRSIEIVKTYLNKNVIKIVTIPYLGYFSLIDQLVAKQEIRERTKADWIIHHDVDEIMESKSKNETLRGLIERVDMAGYTAINFEEFVFVPASEYENYEGKDYLNLMRYYYHFAPSSMRLVRAFKNSIKSNNVEEAGHRMDKEDVLVYDEPQILRHYLCLNFSSFINRYKKRIFKKQELDLGWHANRINVEWEKVQLPSLKDLQDVQEVGLVNLYPKIKHFWNAAYVDLSLRK